MRALSLLLLALAACTSTADDATGDTDVDTDETDVDTDADPFANHPILTQRILNVAHRGGALIAPEETMVAFEAAVEAGANMLEIDVWSTSDGALVLLHDALVDRTTDGTGNVRDFTLADLQALDAGYTYTEDDGATFPWRGMGVKVPTLESVFDAFPDMLYSVEIKQSSPPIIDDVLAMIDAKGLHDKVVVGAFEDNIVRAVRAADPTILTTLGVLEGLELYGLPPEGEATYTAPSPYFAAPLSYAGIVLAASDIEKAHRLGVTLHVWTINDPSEMDTVLDWGVDGVITDDPVTLQAKLDDAGLGAD